MKHLFVLLLWLPLVLFGCDDGNDNGSSNGGGQELTPFFTLAPTTDGGGIVAGATQDADDPEHNRIFLVRLGADGSPQWRRDLEASFLEVPWALSVDATGTASLLALMLIPDSLGAADAWARVVYRVNAQGQPLLRRELPEAVNGRSLRIASAPGGGFWVLTSDSITLDLEALDAGGDVLAHSHIASAPGFPRALHSTADGSVLVLGRTSQSPERTWLLKQALTGAVLWVREYSNLDSNRVFSCLAVDEDGSILLAGDQGGAGGPRDVVVMKLTAEGDSLWQTQVVDRGNASQLSASTTQGLLALAAPSLHQLPEDPHFASVLHLGDDGQVLHDLPPGTRPLGDPAGLRPTADGGHLVLTYSQQSNPYAVCKLSAAGDLLWRWSPTFGF